ncbi:uncharacterized protein LOC121960789 isoform X2 [Plectropomus leopardus]|uniref:uncharacterized protein LOC121960789 isoform X2 n=1 Tax=Plectropomus leopardus TaxID=160734 RepID=UPI001C4B6874|nr:uncharacterized protein LOC121960789 isoform X2 [Plectropomus leopardus]
MKSELIYVSMLTVMSALLVTNSAKPEKAWRWTTASPRTNLQGKMFTLSANRGGISFYPPYFSPSPSSWPATWSYPSPTTRALYPTSNTPYYPTKPTTTRAYYPTSNTPYYPTKPTTTRAYYPTSNTPYYHTKPTTTRAYYPTRKPPYYTTTNYPWTTPPPTRSVSVCLRYLVDYTYSLFTLSPASRNALQVGLSGGGYQLNTKYSYQNLYLRPNIKIWSNIGPDFWTRVCFIVDSVNNVAQVFNGSNMSIRKMLPFQYAWSGEPVIEFSGFDGQVTDIQVWDYPLRYREVFSYMTGGVYTYAVPWLRPHLVLPQLHLQRKSTVGGRL